MKAREARPDEFGDPVYDEVEGEALLAESGILIPMNLPAGTVITVTITIGGKVEENAGPTITPVTSATCPRCEYPLGLAHGLDLNGKCPRCGAELPPGALQ